MKQVEVIASHTDKVRDSLPEVFRLLLMGMIICWHFILYGIPSYSQNCSLLILTALLHVAVPAFVFVSGWYGIKVRLNGFIKLLCMVVFYSVIGYGVRLFWGEDFCWRGLIHSLIPLFKNKWWFINVYLALYLTSPILECFIKHSSQRLIIYTILSLYFVSFWLGASSASVARLPLFWMLYLLGRTLRGFCKNKPYVLYIGCVILTTLAGCCAYMWGGRLIFGMCFFNYTGPILLLTSISLALIFLVKTTKIAWRSRIVNSFALATFPCYLMHEHNFLTIDFYNVIATSNSPLGMILLLTIVTLGGGF